MSMRDEARRWLHTATAGGTWTTGGYFWGFHEACKALVRAARGSPARDALIYPILFQFRHFAELGLKDLILHADQAGRSLDRMGWALHPLPESIGNRLQRTHNLGQLLTWLRERMAALSDEDLDPVGCAAVLELDRMDQNGEAFRYQLTKDGRLQLPEPQTIDLDRLEEQVDSVLGLIFGVDGWLDARASEAVAVWNQTVPDPEGP
jgi:hypothetical protein